jgi:DNA-binding MarR family transcriptional regulator
VTIDDAAVAAWEALFRAQVAVMRRLTAEFPEAEITFGEYDVLFTLSRQPGQRLRLRELNDQVLLAQSSVSRLTDRLAARGLVTKHPSPEDGRGITITLTDDGRRVFRHVARHHMESISRRVAGALTTEELQELTGLCDKLRHADTGEPRRAIMAHTPGSET